MGAVSQESKDGLTSSGIKVKEKDRRRTAYELAEGTRMCIVGRRRKSHASHCLCFCLRHVSCLREYSALTEHRVLLSVCWQWNLARFAWMSVTLNEWGSFTCEMRREHENKTRVILWCHTEVGRNSLSDEHRRGNYRSPALLQTSPRLKRKWECGGSAGWTGRSLRIIFLAMTALSCHMHTVQLKICILFFFFF